MITAINISHKNFDHYSTEENTSKIENLSRVNIFIGPNNSGKSRFLRQIFSISKPDFQFKSKNYDTDGIYKEIQFFEKRIKEHFEENGISDYNGVIQSSEKLPTIRWSNFEIHLQIQKWIDYFEKLKNIGKSGNTTISAQLLLKKSKNIHENIDNIHIEIRDIAKQTLDNLNKLHISDIDETHERVYIPILRGLRPIQYLENAFDGKIDSYKHRTLQDYFSGESKKSEKKVIIDNETQKIYTGLDIYHEVQNKLLGNRDERTKVREFEDFLSSKFFEGRKVTLIPKIDSDVLLMDVEGDNEQLIYNWGDGIQSIIQILYPIFLNKDKKTLVFIEEPEIGLHPGYQRVFLETLLINEFANMQFFMTTHSNHFLDLTIENDNISVYSFQKEKAGSESKFHIKNLKSPQHNILKELGIRNSSIFLSNCTIWVEGITDRKYIKEFLKVYSDHHQQYRGFLEDLHYSFVEYAGSNIVHWNFDSEINEEKMNALRITNNIFLIVDSDFDKESGKTPDTKGKRHEALRQALSNNFYITEGKEIENMLSPKIIKTVIAEYEKKEIEQLQFKTELEKTEKAKSFNGSNRKIEKPIYWKHNLGKFIDENLKAPERNYAENNTIKGKEAFCDKAIQHIKSYDDLSDEAKGLCKKIFHFIENHN